MVILITDFGNAHFGNLDMAKELIYEAKNNGADLVKGQLFDYKIIKGSMSKNFYRDCQLNENQALELMDYADKINIPLFFSIFCEGFVNVRARQKFNKLAAGQTNNMTDREIEVCDQFNYFISMKNGRAEFPKLLNACALYASDYLPEKTALHHLEFFQKQYTSFGYSDHTIGISACVEAVKKYGAMVIEKHICLSKYKESHGKIFRDTIHGILPRELNQLSRIIKE